MKVTGYCESLDRLISAHCLDYERRKAAISEDKMERRTLMEYRFLNYRIFTAAAECVGEQSAELFINEIGQRRGYAKSDTEMCETVYKHSKLRVKIAIARKLNLLD